MPTPLWLTGLTPRRRHVASAAFACVLLCGATGSAQTDRVSPVAGPLREALDRPLPARAFDTRDSNLLSEIEHREGHQPLATRVEPALTQPPRPMPKPPSRRHRSVRTKQAAGAVIGAIGGLVIGGRLGAWLEGDSCHCDDPGFKGFFIGAPIGAGIGAVPRLPRRRELSMDLDARARESPARASRDLPAAPDVPIVGQTSPRSMTDDATRHTRDPSGGCRRRGSLRASQAECHHSRERQSRNVRLDSDEGRAGRERTLQPRLASANTGRGVRVDDERECRRHRGHLRQHRTGGQIPARHLSHGLLRRPRRTVDAFDRPTAGSRAAHSCRRSEKPRRVQVDERREPSHPERLGERRVCWQAFHGDDRRRGVRCFRRARQQKRRPDVPDVGHDLAGVQPLAQLALALRPRRQPLGRRRLEGWLRCQLRQAVRPLLEPPADRLRAADQRRG